MTSRREMLVKDLFHCITKMVISILKFLYIVENKNFVDLCIKLIFILNMH